MPVEGKRYTRKEISGLLGGDPVQYLPMSDGLVTCACLTPKSNPDAPNVILAGKSPHTVDRAKKLCKQGGTIPVFIKRAAKAWEYVGRYEVERCSEAQGDLHRYRERATRPEIKLVVFLKKSP
jgi:hypothetical protein